MEHSMSNIKVKKIDLFNNTSVTYDQTKTSLIGKITNKTIAGRQVVGAPIVKYRNTVLSSEALTPAEIVITDNNRLFAIQLEVGGLCLVAAYDLNTANGDLNYIGRINIQLPEPPATTYTYRGFRVVDDGTTNWKIFILTTANVAAHAGLYMANDLALSDFVSVPPTIPTATAPGQKAVYRLDPSSNIVDGTGLSVDKVGQKVYAHRGVSATHTFIAFNYNGTIPSVGSLGQTTALLDFQTGNLPALTGTLLLTNSEEVVTPSSGPNSGQPCIAFYTSSTMYRGRISDLGNAVTTWPSLEIANNQAPLNEDAGSVTTQRATFSSSLDRVILLNSSATFPSSIIVKQFTDSQRDIICGIQSGDNNENLTKEMYKFKTPAAPIAFDSRLGYAAIVSNTTGARGIYTCAVDIDDLYDSTHIISPVIDCAGQIFQAFIARRVRPDLSNQVKVYYRTSGFASPTGGWVAVSDDLDFNNLVSPTGQIQIKIAFKTLLNDRTNASQLYAAELSYIDLNAISENWEYSHDDSTPGNPSRVAFRLKRAYNTSVPQLFFRARDLSDNLYVQSNTLNDSGLFEYSTDGGVNWLPLGTVPNTVGTLLRYTFAVPPGIDVRPSIGES
jgi:hypothetical protein